MREHHRLPMARALAGIGAVVCALGWPAGAVASGRDRQAQIDRLEIGVTRAEDISALKKLQRAYGHYADRGLWDQLADLFADDAAANYPSGGFDGKASIRAMFVQNLGQGKQGLANGRIYNHTILQPVVDLAPDGATATARWRVLGMLGRFGSSALWADSLYRFDYEKVNGAWRIKTLTAYAGSGGSYAEGWVQPAPRPPGALDRSPIRFNLAHPADRDWRDPCEQDVSVCVVPFPYPNRGAIKPPENPAALITPMKYRSPAARAADLVARTRRLADEQALLNLQDKYGYYVDRGMWREAADLFAPNGTREEGQQGVYLGRAHIRRALALSAPAALRPDALNEHLQLEPIIDVADDGKTASGRVFELAFVGGGGRPARIVQSVAENRYTKRGDVWMIQAMHVYTILATDYDQGWAKSALPPQWASKDFPPDAPPTVKYETYPQVFTPPLHAGFDSASRPSRAKLRAAASMPSRRDLTAARRSAAAGDGLEPDREPAGCLWLLRREGHVERPGAAVHRRRGAGDRRCRVCRARCHSRAAQGHGTGRPGRGRAEQPAAIAAGDRCRRGWQDREDPRAAAATCPGRKRPADLGRRHLRERTGQGGRHLEVPAIAPVQELPVPLQERVDRDGRHGTSVAVTIHAAVSLRKSGRWQTALKGGRPR